MEKLQFIRVGTKCVRIDAITYIEFLDSGRAMIIFPGLAPEKAHLSVDEREARILRDHFEQEEVTLDPGRNLRQSAIRALPVSSINALNTISGRR